MTDAPPLFAAVSPDHRTPCEICLTIPGPPVPWAPTKRNQRTGNRFLPDRQEAAIARNVSFINEHLGGDQHDLIFAAGVPLVIECTFHIGRNKGHYGTGRNASVLKDSAPRYPTGKPDRSNLEKMIEDCLVLARVMPDDDQVIDGHSVKFYAGLGTQPRSVVTVRSLA